MANTTIPSFVETLCQLQLLDRPQLEELSRLQATFTDARLRAAFPHLRSWHEKFADRGLVMVGLTRYYSYGWDDPTKAARKITGLTPQAEQEAMGAFAEHNGLKYRIGFVPGASDLYKRYAVGGIPHVVLIDRQGKIRLIKVGYNAGTSKTIEEMIQVLLAEK